MNKNIKKFALIAMFAAVSFVVFTYGRIDIPLAAGSKVSIHIANAIIVVCAFLLGPVEGGLAGAIGLSRQVPTGMRGIQVRNMVRILQQVLSRSSVLMQALR